MTEVCYSWGMWELFISLLELLWLAFLFLFPMVILPTWITYKVLSWFFP